ncbi:MULTISPECIES: hypothetical protein [unclassified Cyanobium]|uniref:hypothetical protein n=1 Tax=unclassified Cyanobium TaxID=2627006 RepID=UPI0020CCD64B|nr:MULTISPECIES: hypothetical protein [unclassified Cyanobium]MCP9858162.1 hypothetical protein [Cyanobium sp. Cruz-8H5]MCP9865223.1 hypothetical protein [Cyanobium sp. Cruz-8D1]
MDHPFWLLVPWLVFSIGMGLKTWKVTRLINHQLRRSAWGVEPFRAGLERNWQRNQSLS